jgi:hypothetical protein
MEIAAFFQRVAEQFCLLSYWLMAEYLGISQQLSYTFKNCSKAFQQPFGISH